MFVISWQNKTGEKAACKKLVKLTFSLQRSTEWQQITFFLIIFYAVEEILQPYSFIHYFLLGKLLVYFHNKKNCKLVQIVWCFALKNKES